MGDQSRFREVPTIEDLRRQDEASRKHAEETVAAQRVEAGNLRRGRNPRRNYPAFQLLVHLTKYPGVNRWYIDAAKRLFLADRLIDALTQGDADSGEAERLLREWEAMKGGGDG